MWQRLFASLLLLTVSGCGGSDFESIESSTAAAPVSAQTALPVLLERDLAEDPNLRMQQGQTAVILMEAVDIQDPPDDDTGDPGTDVVPVSFSAEQNVTLAFEPEEGLLESLSLRNADGEDLLLLDADNPSASAVVAAGDYDLIFDSAVRRNRDGPLVPIFLRPIEPRAQSILDGLFFLATGDCQGCDFADKDLVFLSYANDVVHNNGSERRLDLANAKLMRARGANSNLRDINFYGANMTDADLSGTDFRSSNCNFVTAKGTNFQEARLYGTTFQDADLREADFRGATGYNLSGAFITTGLQEGPAPKM